jgi:hypothetical protein
MDHNLARCEGSSRIGELLEIVGEKSSELAVVYVTYKFSIKGIWLSWRVLVIETKLA